MSEFVVAFAGFAVMLGTFEIATASTNNHYRSGAKKLVVGIALVGLAFALKHFGL
ncbi:MAG: hypothetical protein IT405_00420 [Candidatus Yanofskybacteria bacterium]|nr:hypothetical protein [Candidatus Yanofskybacteria bacterium]